jgi:hypothetical protein
MSSRRTNRKLLKQPAIQSFHRSMVDLSELPEIHSLWIGPPSQSGKIAYFSVGVDQLYGVVSPEIGTLLKS